MRDVRSWLVVVLGAVVLYQAYCSNPGPSPAEARVAELEAALGSVARQRDALEGALEFERAQRATERDSLENVVAVADTVFVTSVDTLRQIVTDTTALRIIDDLEESHEVALAGKDSIIVGQDRTIAGQDSLLWLHQRQDSMRIEINAALRDRIGELEGQQWKDRVIWGLAGAGACLLVCPKPLR